MQGQALITTLAGNNTAGFAGDNGPASLAELNNPRMAVSDGLGNIYFSDSANAVIRKIDASGIITTIAGNGTRGTAGDNGPALGANIGFVEQLALGGGLLCFGDTLAYKVRCINLSSGTISGFGTGNPVSAGDGGPVNNASFHDPQGVVFIQRTIPPNGVANDLYIADFADNIIRRVAGDTGIVTTIAGPGVQGNLGDGGPATAASFQFPRSLAYFNGSLYIADQGNARVRQLNLSTGIINTVAGNGSPFYAGDGGAATAAALTAGWVTFDPVGQMYIAGAEVIRKVDLSGIITTYAGSGTTTGIGPDNVPPSQTIFPGMAGVYWNSPSNQILISDGTSRIRQITYQGTTTSIAANPTSVGQGGQVTLTATVSNTAATGTVNFLVNGAFVGSAPLSVGQAVFTWTASGGSNTAGAIYTGDANYAPSASGLVGINVTKPATSLAVTANPNPVTQGQNVTLTATVTPSTATGQVQFYGAGGFLGNGTLVNGAATFVIPTINQNAITVYAIYPGDTNNANSTSPNLTITVIANTSVAISSSQNPSQPGVSITFTANITPSTATGTVQFLDEGALLGTGAVSGGSASFNMASFVPGTHSITAVYSGDTNNATSTSAALQQTVNKVSTTTSLAGSSAVSTIGTAVTFTATVSPTSATGTVQFSAFATNSGSSYSLGSAPVVGGVATLSTTALVSGPNAVTAIYSGDSQYAGSTSAAFNEMVRFNSGTSLASSLNPSTFGASVTLTATVFPLNNGQTGSVQFFNGSFLLGTSPLSTGLTAQLITTTLPVGTDSLTAVYSGDTIWASSTSTALSQTVNKVVTTTTVISSLNPSTVGASVTLTATVSPSAATGTVQFLDGATVLGTSTLANGSASCITTSLTQGTHSITAVYSGDANNASSTSTATSQIVKAITSVGLASSLNPAVVGQSVVFTATVNSAATGTVQFLDGAAVLGTGTVTSGVANFTTTSLAQGAHSISAVYSGDTNYASVSSTPLMETVNAKTVTTTTLVPLAGSPNPSNLGALVGFTATVSPFTATGTVQFLDGTIVLATLPISGGSVSFNFQLSTAGQHLITAVYSGDSSDTGSTSVAFTQTVRNATTVSLSSSPNPSLVGGVVTFMAVVSPSSATGTVQFQDGAMPLGAANLSGGMATFSTATLAQGTHTITAVFGGDTNDTVSTSGPISQVVNAKTATSTVVSSSVNPSTVGQGVKFTASVSSTSASGTIQFLDGAAVIGAATLASGSASFTTTSLAQGTHSITASYSGDVTRAASISSALTQTVKVAAPAAPSNLTATDAGSSQINLAWAASVTSGITYDVYESTTSGFSPSASNRIASGVATTGYSATGLTGSKTYYYRVSAVNAGGESADTNQASATTTAALSCHVTYTVTTQWPGGFGGAYSIKNTGTTPITNWNLTWTWPGNQTVTQAWNANYSHTGPNVTFTYESYNATMAAGATLSGMGFNGTWSGSNVAPTVFHVNGTLCQ
jgi:hypothetical protein